MTLLAVGAYGWGAALVRALTHFKRLSDTPIQLDPALNVAIGIALFLSVGGFFVAVNLAYFWFILGWQIVGAVLGVIDVATRRSYRSWKPLFRPWLIPAWAGAIALCYMAIGSALSGAWNINDDGPAYTYLGQRLLATGGLIDPFNTRRLNSYGGAELFQAYIIKLVGIPAGIGIEWFFFLLLSVALFVRTIRRPWATFVIWTVGLGVVVTRPVGEFANVAPTLSGVALTLAIARLLSEHRSESNTRWVYLITGLLFAGIFALRLEFIFGAGALIVVSVALSRYRSMAISNLLRSGVVAVVGLLGWAVALYRSSGTPIFPLMTGNWTQQWWFINPLVHTFWQHLHEMGSILVTDNLDVGVVGALSVAALCFLLLHYEPKISHLNLEGELINFDFDLIIALVIGTVVFVASQAYENSGSTLDDIARYGAPTVLALVLFSLSQLWDITDALSLAANTKGQRPRITPMQTITGLVVLVYFFLFLGLRPNVLGNDVKLSFRQSYRATSAEPVLTDNWNWDWQQSQVRFYKKMNARIPAGSHLLASVALPGDLDMHKFSFTTLDEPGGSSPSPGFNLTGSVDEAVAYLESKGIDGIVASNDKAIGLSNLSVAVAQLHSVIPVYRAESQTTIEWDDLLVSIEGRYETYRDGQLRYISFNRPRRVPTAPVPVPLTK